MYRSKQHAQNSILKALTLITLIIAIPFMAPSRVNAQSGGYGQRLGLSPEYSVFGQAAYASTPDPSLGLGQWAAGPVGITDYDNSGQFIESGPIKNINNDQAHIPYGTAYDSSGNYITYYNSSTRLLGNGTYSYKTVKFSDTGYQSQACYGNGACEGMVTAYITHTLKYAASGNESSDPSVPWGIQGSLYNAYTDTSNVVYAWCYARSVGNTGTISACYNGGDGNADSWQTNN